MSILAGAAFVITAIAAADVADKLADQYFDYHNPAHEEQLTAQQERFGISEGTQESLIEDFGYPGYINHLKD